MEIERNGLSFVLDAKGFFDTGVADIGDTDLEDNDEDE